MLLWLGMPHIMSMQLMTIGVVVSHVGLWLPGRPRVGPNRRVSVFLDTFFGL